MTLAPDLPAAGAPTDDELAALLRDPEIRQSLAVIAANAPTLAVLASMGSALLQRSPEIVDNVNGIVRDLRTQVEGPEGAGGRQIAQAISSLADLAPVAPALAARKETITGFLDSPILQPEIVEIVGHLGEAALAADQATRGRQVSPGGVFALVKRIKDPEVQETLAFLLEFATVFGRRQRSSSAAPPASAR